MANLQIFCQHFSENQKNNNNFVYNDINSYFCKLKQSDKPNMKYTLYAPEKICGDINLPSSKSISNRALIIWALTGHTILPNNLSDCDDTKVMIDALNSKEELIDIKAAGTSMRFLTAYFAVTPGTHIITGTERMKHRPIGILVDALRYIGADIEYLEEEGFPPLKIKGKKLYSRPLSIPGNVSSQFVTALLLIAPMLDEPLSIQLLGDVVSKPYIDLTRCIMSQFGAEVEWTDVDTITVSSGNYTPRQFTIENDWSAASYWYEMLAISDNFDSQVTFTGLQDGSRQGDSVVRYMFSLLGVKTAFSTDKTGEQTMTITRHNRLLPRLEYDFSNQPDQVQAFVVCCAALGIQFKFTGISTLKLKETDRIKAMKTEMLKLGIVLTEEDGNTLIWDGTKTEAADHVEIDTYDDHRMAMAFAPLSIKYPGLTINNPEVVTKSYPSFWEDLEKAGFKIIKEE